MGAGHGFGEWPNNLMKALEIEIDPLKAIGDDGNAEIAMAFANLTGREKAAVRMRFADEMTLVAIGDKLEISQERARQILAKALRKLRHPVPWYILKNGIRDYLDRKIEEIVTIQTAAIREELEKEYAAKLAGVNVEVVDKMSIRVEELDLTVRAYNCLKRSGCNTVGDLLTKYPTIDESLKIRNLGRRSMEEITRSLRSHGIVWPREDVNGNR